MAGIMVNKLCAGDRASFEFNSEDAAACLAAHERGDFGEAAYRLRAAFVWARAPLPAFPECAGSFWGDVCEELESGKSAYGAMDIIRGWLGIPTTAPALRVVVRVAAQAPPTDDQVATWLAAKGMVMIDAKELAALRRNGSSGPPPMDADTFRRITRF